jgi:hypothetical protein
MEHRDKIQSFPAHRVRKESKGSQEILAHRDSQATMVRKAQPVPTLPCRGHRGIQEQTVRQVHKAFRVSRASKGFKAFKV